MTPDQAASLHVRMDHQDEVLDEIKIKVTETNGRVRSLELWRARVQGAYAAGFAVIGLVAGALVQHFIGG